MKAHFILFCSRLSEIAINVELDKEGGRKKTKSSKKKLCKKKQVEHFELSLAAGDGMSVSISKLMC